MRGKKSGRGIAIEWFLDKEKVINSVDKASLGAMKKTGALVRTTARRSIRKGKKAGRGVRNEKGKLIRPKTGVQRTIPGEPGKPPRTWRGFLRKDILFAYDPNTKSVVTGPVTFPEINERMEHGGTASFASWVNKGGRRATTSGNAPKRGGPWTQIGKIQAKYPPRPFMRPALEKSAPQIASFWKNSLK